MRSRIIIAGLTLLLAASLVPRAVADDEGYRHGRLRYVDGGVSLQRASGVGAEEADTNEPFLPGDRVWTSEAGRAEFQFPDGSLVRLDLRSKLDYAGHDEGDSERISLRLWSGSIFLRTRSNATRFEVETPGGIVRGSERSLLRVDVDAGEARVSVFEGEGVVDNGQSSMRLTAGERAYARFGEAIDDSEEFDLGEQDPFARWSARLDAQYRGDGRSARYLPNDLDSYAYEFDTYGDWRYETTVGYVWVPRVAVDWQPYWNGRWCWTPFGWTWVPYESWGWAPAHYGRWGFGAYGWYWIPDQTWGPAWVTWAVGDGYVAWCPLGWRDRPVRDWDDARRHPERGFAQGRDGRNSFQAWHVVRNGELGRRDVAQRRVNIAGLGSASLRVAASARYRPTRDAGQFYQGEATVRALRTKATPGDFVRELAVDNKTTIPSPWFRRGATPRGGEQIRTEQRSPANAGIGGAQRRGEAASTGGTATRTEDRPTTRPSTPWSGLLGGASRSRSQDDTSGTQRGGATYSQPSGGGYSRVPPGGSSSGSSSGGSYSSGGSSSGSGRGSSSGSSSGGSSSGSGFSRGGSSNSGSSSGGSWSSGSSNSGSSSGSSSGGGSAAGSSSSWRSGGSSGGSSGSSSGSSGSSSGGFSSGSSGSSSGSRSSGSSSSGSRSSGSASPRSGSGQSSSSSSSGSSGGGGAQERHHR